MFNKEREAGLLLHITSLPSKYGVGTLGEEAYRFIDYLNQCKLRVWQILPLGPTSYGDSPYQSVSAFAVNYYLIDLDILRKDGLLKESEYKNVDFGDYPFRVNYEKLFNSRIKVLKKAFNRFDRSTPDFVEFTKEHNYRDFGIFMAIKELHKFAAWNTWAPKYRDYSPEVEKDVLENNLDSVLFWQWTQYEFIKQWNDLHNYAHEHNVEIMGDIPLYVGEDSVEMWKNPQLFLIDENKKPTVVSGCPPDAFTDDGQLWGNPCYNWEYQKSTGYAWWNERIASCFNLVDILRIDHFRGFDQFYTIPLGMKNARIGEWVDGPKFDLFKDKLDLNIVAEDLGFLTPTVYELMKKVGFPGMKIIQFAFDGSPDNEHKPSNYSENCICYTGTHDNLTNVEYINNLTEKEKPVYYADLVKECEALGVPVDAMSSESLNKTVIELAFASKARTVIIPFQDLLGQGKGFRMNAPSTVSTDNWSYRISRNQESYDLAEYIRGLVEKYNR